MNGGDRIASVLVEQGVRFLFTLCGGHISPILVGAKQRGIRVVDVRHEVDAVFAAAALLKGRGALQDIDQQALFAPHVKWAASAKAVRDLAPMLEKAFAVARA